MTTKSSEIAKIVDAARALGAPTFDADRYAAAAAAIEARLPKESADPFGPAADPDVAAIESDLAILWSGAEAAMAFIACRYLPAELAAYREREDANALLIAASRVANKYVARQP